MNEHQNNSAGGTDRSVSTTGNLKEFLLRDKLPIWFVIFSSCVVAIGTYWLSPKISYKNETNRMKGQLTLQWLDNQNRVTHNLIKEITISQSLLVNGKVVPTKARVQISGLFSQLQWQAMNVPTLVDNPSTNEIVLSYQISLFDLQNNYRETDTPEEFENLLDKIRVFAEKSVMLNESILDNALK